MSFGTDPLDADTNNNGVNDGEELDNGGDPINPGPPPDPVDPGDPPGPDPLPPPPPPVIPGNYDILVEHKNISFPKHGHSTFESIDPAKRFLLKTAIQTYGGSDGEVESGPFGISGTGTWSIDPITGEQTPGGDKYEEEFYVTSFGDPVSPFRLSGTRFQTGYWDPPNNETDGTATIHGVTLLSEENTTAMMVSNGKSELEDYEGDFSTLSRAPYAYRNIHENELRFDYRKTQFKFKWQSGVDPEAKFPIRYFVLFIPEDDPDTEENEEETGLEIVDTIEWDGVNEDEIFEIDPVKLKPGEDGRYELLKMDVEWQTLGGKTADEDPGDLLENFTVPGDYAEYTDQDLSWLEGQRYFPDSESQATEAFRNKVNVKVSALGYKNGEVKLRAFDVDDPTPIADVDDNDTSGPVGDDNQDTVEISGAEVDLGFFSGEVSTGTKVSENSAEKSITVTLDDNGEAVVEFVLGVQPGNNYRIAAELQIDGQTSEIGNLQVATQGSTYVSGDNEPIAGLKLGAVSDMLTVWRKLHIEIDSMDGYDTYTGTNSDSGNITGYADTTHGKAQLQTDGFLNGDDVENRFEFGILEVGAESIEVLGNSDRSPPGPGDTIDVWNYLAASFDSQDVIGQSFIIKDDDDRYVETLGFGPSLPKTSIASDLVEALKSKYAPAFIEVIDANALGLNPDTSIDFKLNETVLGNAYPDVFNNAKDLSTTQFFWTHTVTFGFQPGEGSDGDSNSEGMAYGVTPRGLFGLEGKGYSAVFVESVREEVFDALVMDQRVLNPEIFNSAYEMERRANKYKSVLYGVTAHEIGHGPDSGGNDDDHAEGGLMTEGDSNPSRIEEDFIGASINRFRGALEWK